MVSIPIPAKLIQNCSYDLWPEKFSRTRIVYFVDRKLQVIKWETILFIDDDAPSLDISLRKKSCYDRSEVRYAIILLSVSHALSLVPGDFSRRIILSKQICTAFERKLGGPAGLREAHVSAFHGMKYSSRTKKLFTEVG